MAVEESSKPQDSPELLFANEQNSAPEIDAEMTLADNIASSAAASSFEPSTSQAAPMDLLYGYSATSFAVQLVALKTFKEVTEYADKFDLNPPMYVKVRSEESDWYAVLLGIYETRTEADAASKEWASSHTTASKPWVRPIPALRKAVNLAAP
jgi:septal ring-binding cell division protein DamX